MINPDVVRNWKTKPSRQQYAAKDVILYALGVGAGGDLRDIPYVYEAELACLPTMAVVLAGEGFWMADPRTGIDWKRLLHGEQRLTIHKPLPACGDVQGRMTVEGLYDRGPGKGAVLVLSRQLYEIDSGAHLATLGMTAMLMGDGGFGGSMEGAPKPHEVPERAPDMGIELSTRVEQAMLYRLSGDLNPLHIDPQIARDAGFERPILHGLCSYGVAGRAILRALCGDDPARLQQLDVRFSSPVYPGETIRTEIWREGPGLAAFRCRVNERDVVVLNNGLARYAEASDA